MLNKKRSGNENIGKLILFTFTIILATSLVALIHHFYTKSKIHAINMMLLVDVKNKWDKLQYIQNEDGNLLGDTTTCNCDGNATGSGRVIFSPVDNTFTMTGITATDNSNRCLNCFSKIGGINLVDNTDTSIEYIIK